MASKARRGLNCDVHTDNKSIESSLCRGATVTISISQRNDTSEGSKPAGSGRAILPRCDNQDMMTLG